MIIFFLIEQQQSHDGRSLDDQIIFISVLKKHIMDIIFILENDDYDNKNNENHNKVFIPKF